VGCCPIHKLLIKANLNFELVIILFFKQELLKTLSGVVLNNVEKNPNHNKASKQATKQAKK
jgi:hypothetical protein